MAGSESAGRIFSFVPALNHEPVCLFSIPSGAMDPCDIEDTDIFDARVAQPPPAVRIQYHLLLSLLSAFIRVDPR
jgi:hypothetical protein